MTLPPSLPPVRSHRTRRGAAVVVVVIIIAMVSLAVMAGLGGGADDSFNAASRLETARAFYAADAATFITLRALSKGTAVPAAGSVITLPGAAATIVSAPSSGAGVVVIQGASGLAARRVEITINQ